MRQAWTDSHKFLLFQPSKKSQFVRSEAFGTVPNLQPCTLEGGEKMHRIFTLLLVFLLAAPLAYAAPGSQLLFLADSGINLRTMGLTDDQGQMAVSEATGYVDAMLANYLSVTNSSSNMAVTVQFDYYNDNTMLVLSFLRVIPAGRTILINPFDHTIPGETFRGLTRAPNVSEALFGAGELLQNKNTGVKPHTIEALGDEGFNSGRFLIAVTAVGSMEDTDSTDDAADSRANVIFPTYLVTHEKLDGTNNIDGTGSGGNDTDDSNAPASGDDDTTTNVGNLTIDNSVPVTFNYLLGHITTAIAETMQGGQTASWGITPISRMAMGDATANGDGDDTTYYVLDGDAAAAGAQGYLGDILHGGTERTIAQTGDDRTQATTATSNFNNRVIDGGALLWSSLHSTDWNDQIVNFVSVADDYGGIGKYRLIAAQTGYRVSLYDTEGDELPSPATSGPPLLLQPVDTPPTLDILVSGIAVYNGSLNDCAMMMSSRSEGWSLQNLVDLVPEAASGISDFAGLNAMIADRQRNNSAGWVKFTRAASMDDPDNPGTPIGGTSALNCVYDHGDGTPQNATIIPPDNVAMEDKRTFKAGTLVLTDRETKSRRFVTTGHIVLRFLTYGAAWDLKPMP